MLHIYIYDISSLRVNTIHTNVTGRVVFKNRSSDISLCGFPHLLTRIHVVLITRLLQSDVSVHWPPGTIFQDVLYVPSHQQGRAV